MYIRIQDKKSDNRLTRTYKLAGYLHLMIARNQVKMVFQFTYSSGFQPSACTPLGSLFPYIVAIHISDIVCCYYSCNILICFPPLSNFWRTPKRSALVTCTTDLEANKRFLICGSSNNTPSLIPRNHNFHEFHFFPAAVLPQELNLSQICCRQSTTRPTAEK